MSAPERQARGGRGPRKVLYAIDALVRGGTELQLTGLVDRLDRDRYRPHLLTIRPSPAELTPADCPHLAWHVPRLVAPGGLKALGDLARLLRRERFDVVQTFFQDSTAFAGTAARLAGVPVRVASFRDLGFWRTRAQMLLLGRVYPLMTGFLCNAGAVRDAFVASDGLDPARFTVIPNGIDTDALPFVDHDGPTRHVGLVGNLTRQVKRADLFVRAAALVAREHPDVTWHLIGDGHLRNELEELARAEGLGDRVVFAGRVADVAARLGSLQVGVICSDSEGFSNAVLEYMFRGCAVVATDVGGNSEAIDDGRTGLLVPPDDVSALAAALARLVTDVPLRRSLAAAARAEATARYDWARCVAAHQDYYDHALAAAGAASRREVTP